MVGFLNMLITYILRLSVLVFAFSCILVPCHELYGMPIVERPEILRHCSSVEGNLIEHGCMC